MGVLGVYNPLDLEFDHGDGVYLYTDDGTRYLDFTSGIGVTSLGYSHPGLLSALKEQSEKLWHCSNLFRIENQQTVADKITQNSFAESVFFCNSGTYILCYLFIIFWQSSIGFFQSLTFSCLRRLTEGYHSCLFFNPHL